MKTKFVMVFFTLLVAVLAISCNNGILNDRSSDPVQMTKSSRSVTVSGNLLSNSSFEDGSISPWKSWDLAGGAVSIGDVAHSGSKSLKLPFRTGYSHSNYARVEVNNLLTEGHVYYYEAWVKMDGSPGRGAEVFCHLGLEDSNGSNVRSMFFRQEYVQNSWVKINGSFSYRGEVAASDKLFLYMGAFNGGGSVSNAYVDEVFLQDLGKENLKPFPQNDSMIKQTTPKGMSNDQMNSDITSLYKKWKDKYLVKRNFTNGALNGSFSGYVLLGEANGHLTFPANSQSEAVGYTMIMMAIMAKHDPEARTIFDKMYQLYLNFPSKHNGNLMSWAIPTDCNLESSRRLSCATDGDMDVAYALLMANDQWGGGPQGIPNVNTTYYDAAVKIINVMADVLIYDDETGPHFPRLGDSDDNEWGKAYKRRATRSSDFMIGHCELFYEVTNNYLWRQVAENMIKISEHIQAPHNNGLMPDFMWNEPGQWNVKVKSEQPGWSDESGGLHDDDSYYNACRYPFRISTARAHFYQYSGTQRIVDRTNNWTNSDPYQIKGGYELDGTPLVTYASTSWAAPMMTCLMFSNDSQKLKNYWDFIKRFEPEDEWSTYYFQNTIKLFSLNLVAGNWWKPTGEKNARQGGPVTAPQWQVNKYYNNGDLVSYSGSVWKNSYPHTSNSAWYPGAPGLWFWTKQ